MPQGKGVACILLHWRVCEHNSKSLLDAKEKLAWSLQLKAAERRTPTGVTSLYRDKWTAVAKSTVAGRGLFAMRKIPAGFALYVYTGVKRTSQDADRYPNAYQLELNDGSFCDAGDASHSSPARWVNTRDRDLKLPRIDQVSESATIASMKSTMASFTWSLLAQSNPSKSCLHPMIKQTRASLNGRKDFWEMAVCLSQSTESTS